MLAAIIGAALFIGVMLSSANTKNVPYTSFLKDVESHSVEKVFMRSDNAIFVSLKKGAKEEKAKEYLTVVPKQDPTLVPLLVKSGVEVKADTDVSGEVGGSSILMSFLPIMLLGAIVFFVARAAKKGGGQGMAFGMGKSTAKKIDGSKIGVTLKDVAGCDEAVEEVKEIVDFLKNQNKFKRLGGKIPKGALMVGPPGTGKTLIAKAIAGEAGVPFFSLSGSDFVEMFVGVGASRVRSLFDDAKKAAPSIIFIDEIDAIGRKRGGGQGGGNDEREQTLNQLLVEMDGFEANSGVIVLAATNRLEVLDKALLRPGRFDRKVSVGLPDIKGRERILTEHMRKVPINLDVSIPTLAKGTPGFSGAELANLVNEAALLAAKRNLRTVSMLEFEDAKDKVFMGPERKSMVMSEDERKNTAYHEAGHAVVAALLPKADPVHKVTIMPRGFALGLTWQLPSKDKVNGYKDRMLEEISILFGGRLAEEIFLNNVSTGASNDFERATDIARSMVSKYGMSSLGVMVHKLTEDGFVKNISEGLHQKIETEIQKILTAQYDQAKKLLEDNRSIVEEMVVALMALETIDANDVQLLMSGASGESIIAKAESNKSLSDTNIEAEAVESASVVTSS